MKKGENKGRTRTFPVDPNVPRWVCQNCRNPLCIVGADSYADKFFNDPSRYGSLGFHYYHLLIKLIDWYLLFVDFADL